MKLLQENPKNLAVIGKPIRRVVGRKKVTGGLRYTAEINPADLLYAFPITSTVAAGSIRSIDASKAEALEGVVKVYTHENMTDIGEVGLYGLAGRGGTEFAPLQSAEIRYDQQLIGVVVARTIEAGEQGALLVTPTYAPAAAHSDLKAREATPVQSEERGDLEAGRRAGEVEVEIELHQPMHFHNPIEPVATVAVWNGPQLTVYEPSQGITSLQTYLGRALKMPVENIRVLSEYIGGGFGVKGTAWHHTPITALIAKELGQPVKMLPSRENQYGIIGNRPESIQHIKVSAKRDGTMTAYEMTARASTSLSDTYISPALVHGHLMINACPNAAASQSVVRYNTNTPVPMRSPGEAEAHYAHSVAVDVLADKLGLDPLTVHERNYAEINHQSGNPWSAKHLREAWTAAAAAIDWDQRKVKPRQVTDADGMLVGYGMSIGAYPGYQSIANAKVRLLPDGTAMVMCGSQSLGQGNYTVMAQACAETLGIAPTNVSVSLGDTDLPRAQLTGGSRSASAVTAGVMKAAEDAKRVLFELAALPLADTVVKGMKPDELEYVNNQVRSKKDPSKVVDLQTVLDKSSQQYVEGFGVWGGKEMTSYEMSRLMTGNDFLLGPTIAGRDSYSYVATFARVKVNPRTGMYQIDKITSGYDCGQVMNPKLAESQCKGGIIFAIGHACSEETAFDPVSARIVNGNLADYHIAVNADVPDIEIIFVNKPDLHVHPQGMKGVGEVAGTGAAAAVLNALYNATGKRVTELPAYPEKLIG